MKIALVTTPYLPSVGGAENVVHELARHWQKAGHCVKVFFEAGSGHVTEAETGYPVQSYRVLRGTYRFSPHRFPFAYYNSRVLCGLLSDFSPDLISAHFGYPVGVWLRPLCQQVPSLVTCHGKDLTEGPFGYRRRYRCDSIMSDSLNCFSAVIAISRYARQQLEQISINSTLIHDIPNGVDVARFRCPAKQSIRARFNIPDDAFLILSVGRNSAEKAYHDALEVIFRIGAADRPIYYLIIGSGVDKLTEQVGSHANILLCQGLFGDDLVAAYQQADLYFSASISELCPLTVLEAMAAGKPLVLSDISGHQDVVDHGVNGFLAEPGDLNGLAGEIEKLLRNQELLTKMGSANAERAARFTWARIADDYLAAAGLETT